MKNITLISLIILITSVFYVTSFKTVKGTKCNVILGIIIILSLMNELISVIFINNNIPIQLNSNIYVLLSNSLWLYLLLLFFNKKPAFIILITILLCIINMIFFETPYNFNYNSFLITAICYIAIYLLYSYKNLKDENLQLFQKNEFILISAPIIFFFGFAILIAFRDKNLTRYVVFGDITLYSITSFVSNFLYYILLLIYIYKERKLKNA